MKGLQAIREARLADRSAFTISGIAKAMGVTEPTYRKWEKHPEKLTFEQAVRLADYLGCEIEDIFYLPNHTK